MLQRAQEEAEAPFKGFDEWQAHHWLQRTANNSHLRRQRASFEAWREPALARKRGVF